MKDNKKTSLFIGSLMVIFIISTPYLLYFYQNIPDDLKTMDTIFGTVKNGYYATVQIYIYTLFSKFVPLMLLFIWFITNKNWWVHALIIPISVYLFQLIAVINDSELYMDEVEFIYTVPFLVVILVILYFIRSKISIYIQAVDLKKEMDENMRTPKKFG
ncbi:MAG: hypothetical protein A3F91_07110 [Flavobacteria bacterium RIFCSPLOWO2_12_FULL_35_11]|nr:MAG: hypothetical protein A3F91_07110 [Flavobacteria bacterium RIFCSPLOWO2_12_FULL_35_11]